MLKLVLRNIQRARTNHLLPINRVKLNIQIGVHRMSTEIKIDKEELRKRLTPLQYHITQEKGTERPFSGCYNKTYDDGLYVCIVCEQPLFSSDTKYDSSCGWPAFNDVLDQGKVKLSPDTSGVNHKVKQQPNNTPDISKYFVKNNSSSSRFKDRRNENNMDLTEVKSDTLETNCIENNHCVNKKRKELAADISPPHKKSTTTKDNFTLGKDTTTALINGTNYSKNGINTEISVIRDKKDTILPAVLSENNSLSKPYTNGNANTVTELHGLDKKLSNIDFDDWEDDIFGQDFALDLRLPCRCRIIDITYQKSRLTLSLISLLDNQKGLCQLEGIWLHTNLKKDDIIYIFAENINGVWLVNNEYGLVVLEPDLLISSTSVVGSVWCKRKNVLSARFRGFSSTNQVMLIGNLVHSTFQFALQNNITDTNKLKDVVKRNLKNKSIIMALYECEISLETIETEVFNYIPKIQEFISQYCKMNVNKKLQNSGDSWNGNIIAINDIEENIWCHELGIKGKIDVTLKTTNELVMPLELKTGKATVSLEHRGQVLLYLMMMKRIGHDVNSGLLFYIKEGLLKEIKTSPHEQRDLIHLRNELVYYLNKRMSLQDDKMVPPELPEPINNRWCTNCEYQNICTVYAHYTKENIVSKKTLVKIQEETLKYLNQSHLEYFMKWFCLLMLEGESNEPTKGVKEIYLQTPEEREAQGRCIANVKLSNVLEGTNDMFEHTFQKDSFNFIGCGILEGKYVLISTAKRYAIAAGWVTVITSTSITISLERNLNQNFKNQTFSIDSYDSSFSEVFNFSSLTLLLDPTEKAENLRKIIIDKSTPTFKPTLSKTIGTKGRSILKRLNKVQQRAVLKAVVANEYFLIKGMPGTGKTATIIALIQLLYELDKTILITSHTNSAVDNVCLKLLQYNVKFMRLGSNSKINKDLWEYSEQNLTKNCTTPEEYDKIFNSFQIVAVTCLASGHPVISKRSFDICIVDESTQVLQCSVIRPLYACKTFILIGDPEQLPAVVRNGKARDLGMAESLFERLLKDEATIALNINYRMNQTITDLANSFTYRGELTVGNDIVKNATITIDKEKLQNLYGESNWILKVLDDSLKNSVQFVDTGPVWNLRQDTPWKINKNEESDQNSKCNVFEAAVVFKIVHALLNTGVDPKDIGVIASYRFQVEQISAILNVDVFTVDQYQGKDKSVIIYSCGNSRNTETFNPSSKHDILEDKRRLTVALTRAKHKLIIVGDTKTLIKYSTFKKLLSLVHNNIKLYEYQNFNWENVLDLNKN